MNMDLQTAYERIQNSKSPIEEVGTIILETGGQWNPAEAADPSKLFTIHLHQIQGVGIGAAAALDDWMHKTREFLGAKMFLDRIWANNIVASHHNTWKNMLRRACSSIG